MNPSRRKFFGLSMVPLGVIVPTAAVAVTGGESVPLKGTVRSDLFINDTRSDTTYDFRAIAISLPKELSGHRYDSARLVEVDIGGKREYVMTFEKIHDAGRT